MDNQRRSPQVHYYVSGSSGWQPAVLACAHYGALSTSRLEGLGWQTVQCELPDIALRPPRARASARVCELFDVRFVLAFLQSPPLVREVVQRHVLHDERREESDADEANHDAPDDRNALSECALDLLLKPRGKRADGGDGGVGESDSRWELLEERGRKPVRELVLEDRPTDGDTPDL